MSGERGGSPADIRMMHVVAALLFCYYSLEESLDLS